MQAFLNFFQHLFIMDKNNRFENFPNSANS